MDGSVPIGTLVAVVSPILGALVTAIVWYAKRDAKGRKDCDERVTALEARVDKLQEERVTEAKELLKVVIDTVNRSTDSNIEVKRGLDLIARTNEAVLDRISRS